MNNYPPIRQDEIREGDTIRWERQGVPTQGVFEAVEYVAAYPLHMYNVDGQHYLLHRPEPPKPLLRLGWTCGGVIVSDVDGLKRDVADGIPWEHGDDDFVEGVLVPKRQWDGMAARVDAGREWGSNSYDGGILTSAKALVAATRRINGGDDDE